jgi:hypothetical protein
MIGYLGLAILALVSASTVTAAEPQARDESADQPKAEKKICRTETAIGNRAKRVKTCMTQSQWNSLADGSRRAASEYINDQNRVPPQAP